MNKQTYKLSTVAPLQVGSDPKIGIFFDGPFCARNGVLCTNHPLVAHSAPCLYIETGVHILPLVAHSALCLYIETGVHILPLVAHSALCLYIETGVHILPLVAHSALYLYIETGVHILPLVAHSALCTCRSI